MASSKMFPPMLDGALPAFYKNYDDNHEKVTGASINIPFSLGRAVSVNEIYMISARLSTTSTNSLVLTLTTDQYNFTDENMAYFKLDSDEASKLNEGQYYRVQLAFIDANEVLGYYSTVGIIKCVAKPKCSLNNFTIEDVNVFTTEVVGVYEQDTIFGDTTEKAFKYRFLLSDKDEATVVDSGWLLHDSTQDIVSESSRDIYRIYNELDEGEIGTLQYSVETINGLLITSPPYKIMKIESVDLEYPLEIYTLNNFNEGCIEIKLHGIFNHGAIGQEDLNGGEEAVYSGTFVITRADEYSDYKEWREITRFIISGDYASHFGFRDFTVEQGVYYRYGIQQYNINYMYSEKVLSYDTTPYQLEPDPMKAAKDAGRGPVRADFEDMFLFDGKRQLKIRFNPKVTSFKNTIPEQKIETIGSKYPFIFRNGHTNYKEFPIGGLISYTADDSALFLYDRELQDAHILDGEQIRRRSNPYGSIAYKDEEGNILKRLNYTGDDSFTAREKNYYVNEYDERDPRTHVLVHKRDYVKYKPTDTLVEVENGKRYEGVWHGNSALWGVTYFDPVSIEDTNTGKSRQDLWLYDLNDCVNPREVSGVVRQDRNLTSENMTAERFFKLKVLDWLTDGNVKLFRSPTEGNYLVRLINTQLQPQEQLGRMIHSFTTQAYELDEVTYDNLVYYHIISKDTPIVTSTLWKTIDMKEALVSQNPGSYTELNLEENIPLFIYFDDFMPGDTIRIMFKEEAEPFYYVIGSTGNYYIDSEDRRIIGIAVKKANDAYAQHDPIEYSRLITYAFLGLGTSRFDAIFGLKMKIPVAESFVGPKDNLFDPYDIAPTEEEYQDGDNYLSSEKDMTERIFNSLVNRTHINYTIGEYANKFKALTLETLHARKRHVLPIYACENLQWDRENQHFTLMPTGTIYRNTDDEIVGYENEGTLFCVTPFGIGYVNGKMMYGFRGSNVYIITPEEQIDSVNTERLNLLKIQEELPYLIDYEYEGYDLLKVYVPKVKQIETDNNIPVIDDNAKKLSWGFVMPDEDPMVYADQFYKCSIIPSEGEEPIDNIFIVTTIINDIFKMVNKTNPDDVIIMTGKTQYYIENYPNYDLYVSFNDPSFWNGSGRKSYIEAYRAKFDNIKLEPAKNSNDIYDAWEENPDKEHLYFDTYTHSWWPGDREYDPTFSIINFPEFDPKIIYTDVKNSFFEEEAIPSPLVLGHKDGTLELDPIYDPRGNIWIERDSLHDGYKPVDLIGSGMESIDLTVIDEFVINDMRAPDRLRVGSGVVIEVSPRLQIVEYTVEEKVNECWRYKQEYLKKKKAYWDLLVSAYKDSAQIETKMANYHRLLELIAEKESDIIKFTNAMKETDTLAGALVDKLLSIDKDMYHMQNDYLNYLYNLLKNLPPLPTSIENNASDFVSILSPELRAMYNNYTGLSDNSNVVLDDRTIYNRNYYYNTKLGQFYYTEDPTDLAYPLLPSDQLTFYYNTQTDINGNETSVWESSTNNGVYTLWSSEDDYGDKFYNAMLKAIYEAAIMQTLGNTNIPVYALMDQLYTEIGRIPAWVHTYGEYRAWLQSLLNKKVGRAYALLHYYDSLPEDLDYVLLDNENGLMTITPDFDAPLNIKNHPYAALSYFNPSFINTDGLLYMYLRSDENNSNLSAEEKRLINNKFLLNDNLTQKILLDQEFMSAPSGSLSYLKNTFNQTLKDKNNIGLELIAQVEEDNRPVKFKRSICKHKADISWNVEKDYYIKPVWLEVGNTTHADDNGPGFYGVYLLTDMGGKPKGKAMSKQTNSNTFRLYLEQVQIFESDDFETLTDNEKANVVNNINTYFNDIRAWYNGYANTKNPPLPEFELCKYADEVGNEVDEQITYQVTQKYPQDYYYNEYGQLTFNESIKIYFDYPISLINPKDETTGKYAIDYLGDYTINIWSKVNGLLVDDLDEIKIPNDIVEGSAQDYYYQYLKAYKPDNNVNNNRMNSFSKNTVLSNYYIWQDKGRALQDIQNEYYYWGNGIDRGDGTKEWTVTRAGITGQSLVDIEPLEEEINNLVYERDKLSAQLRAAAVLTRTELYAGRLQTTDKKFTELINLMTDLIDIIGVGYKDFISMCSYDETDVYDRTVLGHLNIKKSKLNDQNFDEEENYIAEINNILKMHEYTPGVGYLRDINHNIYTYYTWKVLTQREKISIIRQGYLTQEVVDELDELIAQINAYANKYKAYRYKYIIRDKTDTLYNLDTAIVLRIRDSYINEIQSLKQEINNEYTIYLTTWQNYVSKINTELNPYFWNADPVDLGINLLIQKYQKSLNKADDDSLNDSSISGAIHEYQAMLEEFLHYYYATQIHTTDSDYASEVSSRMNDASNFSYNYTNPETGVMTQIPIIITPGSNNPDSEDYLPENADKYYDNYKINYDILLSLNEIQKEYTAIINSLKDSQAEYQAALEQLNVQPGEETSGVVDKNKEVLEIQYALAQYLAALGYRYYHEVEMLYKK